VFFLLYGVGGVNGANFRTVAAIGAKLGVDNIDVAFADSFNRAFGFAEPASNAIVINKICHKKSSLN
jgi:hypothetical protein